ncbi:Translin-associated factor X-interacting protein 1 [Phytophthora pseudosyringae]|uniref:Translin-associated factor X-interacting protein 1 n=1 Tax=Phytophthora pseudosyringae TaxID=221518 RepID=A0A8T1VP43_9STRA|nr:Translin-associated factor X-interacting protein 1 [Phytophthora pseudosyringae]
MTLTIEGDRTDGVGCHRPPQVPQLELSAIQAGHSTEITGFGFQDARRSSLGSNSLPPVHANTVREKRDAKGESRAGGSQTSRIRFAPPSRSKERAALFCRARLATSSAKPFCERTSDLHQKKLNTARSFETLENWHQSMEPGVLKNLLADVHDVLFEAIYRKPEEACEVELVPSISSSTSGLFVTTGGTPAEENNTLEYFALVADLQEKVKVQQQERQRLATRLAMENSLEQDLSNQLQLLERELAQLHMRHAYNRAEIEGERRAVQILERDYASLTEEEQELQRDCEVLELQLDTQRAQLKEIRSQQLYLDFVSSAPLKRHMEEKKWQEQHAAVALQVQNADTENRALEDEIRKLEEEASNLEAQYVRDIQTQHQSEAALSETQGNFEQFQEAFERTRICYTPRPDWDRIVDETPELSVGSTQDLGASINNETDDKDKGGVLERLDSTNNIAIRDSEEQSDSQDRTKTLVKEMLHWIERLQKHCGVNLHLSRIWHDIEEARVELNILHHQLDRAVRKTSVLPIVVPPNALGVITIAAATSPTSGSPSKRKQDYIMALGTHEGVPLFLRHRGKLKRRVLKKVDVEKVVRKVWVEKRKREQRNPLGRFPLEQVLYEKLHRKYGFQPLIAEWGYNLLLALQMFSWDSEIEMFLLCLTGAVSDLAYVDQEQLIQGCQQLLLRLCELYNVESFVTERRVLLKDALVALRTYFPLKTSAQLQAIEQAIIRDMHKMKRGGNDSILYIEDILPLDVKYPLGFFVKTIRTQHFKEIQDYYGLLLSELEQRDIEQRGILPLAAVRDAILVIDPLADPNTVQNVIMKAMHIKTRLYLHLRDPVLYKAVLRKMNATCLMKFALNFDQNAEVNWRRRPGAVYVDASAAGI